MGPKEIRAEQHRLAIMSKHLEGVRQPVIPEAAEAAEEGHQGDIKAATLPTEAVEGLAGRKLDPGGTRQLP